MSFTYTVSDGSLSAAGTATLDIAPVNDAPTTTPVTLTAIGDQGAARLITQAELLVNATDVDSPGLSATGLSLLGGTGTLEVVACDDVHRCRGRTLHAGDGGTG